MLVRPRPGLAGQAARTVHLVPHGICVASGAAVSAVCGALLVGERIETVVPGEGMPCTMCLLLRCRTPKLPASADPPPLPNNAIGEGIPTTGATPTVAAGVYRAWDWPVSLRGDRVLLLLSGQAGAAIIPTGLAIEVVTILAARGCQVPVLAHPHAPEHRAVLSGEPYGVPLPWQPQVHIATGTLPLPPTVTPRGPVTWVQRPQPYGLRMCREIDVFAAVRTALRAPP